MARVGCWQGPTAKRRGLAIIGRLRTGRRVAGLEREETDILDLAAVKVLEHHKFHPELRHVGRHVLGPHLRTTEQTSKHRERGASEGQPERTLCALRRTMGILTYFGAAALVVLALVRVTPPWPSTFPRL